jgi:hypothetical protein
MDDAHTRSVVYEGAKQQGGRDLLHTAMRFSWPPNARLHAEASSAPFQHFKQQDFTAGSDLIGDHWLIFVMLPILPGMSKHPRGRRGEQRGIEIC